MAALLANDKIPQKKDFHPKADLSLEPGPVQLKVTTCKVVTV